MVCILCEVFNHLYHKEPLGSLRFPDFCQSTLHLRKPVHSTYKTHQLGFWLICTVSGVAIIRATGKICYDARYVLNQRINVSQRCLRQKGSGSKCQLKDLAQTHFTSGLQARKQTVFLPLKSTEPWNIDLLTIYCGFKKILISVSFFLSKKISLKANYHFFHWLFHR